MSVTPTVRSRIMLAIKKALLNLPNVGAGAVTLPGYTSKTEIQAGEAAAAANLYAIDLGVGPDERLPESEKGSSVEFLSMEVTVRIWIPAAPLAADGSPATIDETLCGELHGLMYKTYTTGQAARGRWLDIDTNAELSRATWLLGGGGLYVDAESGRPFTVSVFEVRYAHLYGDPNFAK